MLSSTVCSTAARMRHWYEPWLLACTCFGEDDWSLCVSSGYGYDFYAGVVSCVDACVEPVRKRLNDDAMKMAPKFPKEPVKLVDGTPASLSKAKSQVRQLPDTWYPLDLEKSPGWLLRDLMVSKCSLGTWMVKLISFWPISRYCRLR